MAWSQNATQIQWSASDTVSVAGDGTETSDDFTASSSLVHAEIQFKAEHSGTPDDGDYLAIHLEKKGDPDQDAADEYDNLGTFITLLDLSEEDPAVRTVPVAMTQGETYRLRAVNNDPDSSITLGARLTEVSWS